MIQIKKKVFHSNSASVKLFCASVKLPIVIFAFMRAMTKLKLAEIFDTFYLLWFFQVSLYKKLFFSRRSYDYRLKKDTVLKYVGFSFDFLL